VKIALLTTDTTHHRYFCWKLQDRFPIDLVLLESRSAKPGFETHHPFEDQRDVYEREELLRGCPQSFDEMTQTIRENDRILFYLAGARSWAATAIITTETFHDDSPLYGSKSIGELRPNRVKLQPRMVLNDEEFIDASVIAPRLDYLKFWYPEDWPLAFIELMHLLPARDFRLIESEMKRIIIKDSSQRQINKNPRVS